MKRFFSENLGLKLISVIIALLLELYFYSPDNSVVRNVNLAVDFRNLPNDLVVVSPVDFDRGMTVQVTVRGPAPLVDQFSRADDKVIVSLPNRLSRSYSVKLNNFDVPVPSGMKIVEIRPSMIELRFDKLLRKEVPVDLERVGALTEDLFISDIRATPRFVSLIGPESELSSVQMVSAEPIDLAKVKADQSLELQLIPPRATVKLSTSVVHAYLSVRKKQALKSFDKIPVQVVTRDGYAAAVSPGRVKVDLTGPNEVLEKINTRELKLEIDCRSYEAGVLELDPEVILDGNSRLQEGVYLVSTTPSRVTVNINKSATN
ncbi:hypothetical protein JNK13_01610 [bacterium]|nr:hypothetical protein [bacterium]